MCDDWLPVPDRLVLAPTAVHLHRLRLTQKFAPFYNLLAPDERIRAARFQLADDRRRYAVARGALRMLIGRYENIPPQQIQFAHNDFGKPLLLHETDLQFNVSHSQDLALLAFSRGRLIGVDVEFKRPLADAEDMAAHYFSPGEYDQFRQLGKAQQQAAFFSCWTRKEAFIKAIGEGLSHPLHTFAVTFVPGEVARFLWIAGQEIGAWKLRDVKPHPDCVAAIAVNAWTGELSCFEWEPT